jgi:molecular chaperone DnaK
MPEPIAIGIDLGTTNSVVAALAGGRVKVIPDADGRPLHPSVVAFLPDGTRAMGRAARARRLIDPANTVFSAKRIIGQPFSSDRVQEALAHLPYRVVGGDNQEPIVVTRGGRHQVAEVSSFILGDLKALAEAQLGAPVAACVVTVPANFSDGQREATRQAAEQAGMQVLRILNEPTAAALAYGMRGAINQRVVVFDLGGGTFDCTALAIRDGLYEVLATGGDPYLGGDDIDQGIAEDLAMDFLHTHRLDPRTDPNAMGKLLMAAEQVKIRLSEHMEVEGTLKELAYGIGGAPLSLPFKYTRGQLERHVRPLVERALALTEQVLAEASITPQIIDEVLLVGGATRVPVVREAVAAVFGRRPRVDIDPMQVVAVGAAYQAHALTRPDSGHQVGLLMDVTSHALGIATAGGYSEVLIPKNTPIPAEGSRTFATAADDQTLVKLRVCQGSERRFDANNPIGELVLSGLPAAPRGKVQVEVSFLIDADGILQVSARDLVSGNAARATLTVLGVATKAQMPAAQ